MSPAVAAPRVVSVEEAAAKLLTGGRKSPAATTEEPTTDDPFVPTPGFSRKRTMSMTEMERIAEQMAQQPDPVDAPRSPVVVVPDDAQPAQQPILKAPTASDADVLARYGLTQESAGALGRFLAGRSRLTIELQDGSIHVPVIAVLQSAYSITIIAPLKLNETTFVPRPGTEVTLRDGALDVKAYYPGAYAELPALGLAIMTFIRETEHGKT
jgi:hypothetical protein